MSMLVLRHGVSSLTRLKTVHTLFSATPKTLVGCCKRYIHDPTDLYPYWSYDPPGFRKKGESYLGYLKRNFHLRFLEVKNDIMPRAFNFEQSRTLWQYDGPESINAFTVSTDQMIGGKSSAYVTSSRNNKLLFYGRVATDVPKDGETVRSGYCNLQMKKRFGAFNKEVYSNLQQFNKLSLRVRGDGRSYLVNMKTRMYYANLEHDLWSYVFFTRGGPYWQDITLPFSKFFLASQGRINDMQAPLELDKVFWIGIMLADKVDGEFSLEIDSIKVEYDPSHFEEFAYEKYSGFKV